MVNDDDITILNKENLDRDDVLSVAELRSKDWKRDKVQDHVKSLKRSDKSSERSAQDAKDFLAKYKGHKVEGVKELREQMKQDYSNYFDEIPKNDEGRPMRYPDSYVETLWEREKKWREFAAWQARMKMADRFVALKVSSMYIELLDEYRLAKSYDTIEDALENKVKDKVSQELTKKESEMQQKLNTLKQLLQATREERNSLHNVLEKLAEEGHISGDMVEDVVEKSTKEGLDQFVNDNGMVVLDDEELSEQNKRSELDDAADSAADSILDDESDSSESQELSVEDKIARDWEKDELYMMDASGISDLYGTEESVVEEVIEERDLDTRE
jgi:uncharacterized protein YdaT